MKRTLALCVALCLAVAATNGCGRAPNARESQNDAVENAVETNDAQDRSEEATEPQIDDSPMNIDDPDSPEGAVNAFFNSFFTGDDEGAFAMLSSRAQASRRDQFSAQASSTVRWRITRKLKPFQGRVLVMTEVEDYTDSGELQSDSLTFVLTNDEGAWRIAAFSVGELAINFEDRSLESVDREPIGELEKKALMAERRVRTNMMR